MLAKEITGTGFGIVRNFDGKRAKNGFTKMCFFL
jgi:hypothetical protein